MEKRETNKFICIKYFTSLRNFKLYRHDAVDKELRYKNKKAPKKKCQLEFTWLELNKTVLSRVSLFSSCNDKI